MRFAALSARFARWRRYRRTLRALDTLSQRELDDIGIGRWQIPEIARTTA
ncbi:MAG: DUF1127 domain-containing protein [Kiloniellales bacterium]